MPLPQSLRSALHEQLKIVPIWYNFNSTAPVARLTRPCSNHLPKPVASGPIAPRLRLVATGVCRSESARPAGFVMLLTRRACYGLLATQHLAGHPGEGSLSATDLAEFYGLPHEALAKILQRLAAAGVLVSHHGIKGGYTLAREGRLEAPKHLARTVHDLYFEPKYEEFQPRTIWSLSNAFTSAFKELDPIPQFKATAGRIPGGPVLPIVLARGALLRGRLL